MSSRSNEVSAIGDLISALGEAKAVWETQMKFAVRIMKRVDEQGEQGERPPGSAANPGAAQGAFGGPPPRFWGTSKVWCKEYKTHDKALVLEQEMWC